VNVTLLCHSLVSDWNHGNAHFLRGVARELGRAGHVVDVLEPAGGWSREQLRKDAGEEAERAFARAFPELSSRVYDAADFDADAWLAGAEVVIVHDWVDPEIARAIGERRARRDDHRLLFYDAHHRAVSAPAEIESFDLRHYDGVLAFGSVIRDAYLERGWARRAWTWHEAADTSLFTPQEFDGERQDLVWIGNWGDGERTAELNEFLLEPARSLELSGSVRGVRYPPDARDAVARSGLRYGGWVANFDAPALFARHRLTVHVPRRAYAGAIPGVPTIRVFEALACGIPLICAPWQDTEGLFRPGEDFAMAADGEEMRQEMRRLLDDPDLAAAQAERGLERIRERHTCVHRVQELQAIIDEVQ